jgi:hypothetical protein
MNWKAFELMMEKICKLEMNLMNEKLEDYENSLKKLIDNNIYDKFNDIEKD